MTVLMRLPRPAVRATAAASIVQTLRSLSRMICCTSPGRRSQTSLGPHGALSRTVAPGLARSSVGIVFSRSK